MDLNLDGKKALVTGASSGIGRAIAVDLSKSGVEIALTGRNEMALERVRETLAAAGGSATVVVADLATKDGAEVVASAVLASVGSVDILVNNAGAAKPLQSANDEAAWESAFALNFAAPRRLAELLIPSMVSQGWGRVINITSGTVPTTSNAAGPAKAALNSWAKTRSFELAPFGVTVNCIAPGRIKSAQMPSALYPTPDLEQEFISRHIPAGRFGEPEELARLATFLASPMADYITGTILPVDGGMHRLAM